MNTLTIDPVWENDLYSQGHHLNRYPFDVVVSFLFRWRPRAKARGETDVVELGCGAGNNLWFAAREGFRVAGIDGSPAAIAFARNRLAVDGLAADLRVGNFLDLPWPDASFDLAIDRGSLTCASLEGQKRAVAETHRVLRPGGVFFYNGYSDRHASARAGVRLPDGRIGNISGGTLTGVGSLCFSSRHDVEALFADGWELLRLEHMVNEDLSDTAIGDHAEWRAVARKK